jgi:N-methylhydantoinase B
MPGRNRLNGNSLPAKTTVAVARGDRLLIETPGGGGFGAAGQAASDDG